ncbi:hypothetical protein LX15_000031 [Streptoalloteichus tenebrarius]|uniref:Uncharacterized protein n=1 Tax=Streptoalloteichus tenebrarius (strain ATCC 17920 / DSM 40477 / JCM 4838 / CBS 697.72 / NBRC 16177 / NCIMB 11028 / NRRL B-12390 / A12253. 1 / ISP 5477) TaxID=1933 RepID=A0ABT1HLG4_STRSD|nr:hypothetical protein [Streptoalloteichus tenebrarius]
MLPFRTACHRCRRFVATFEVNEGTGKLTRSYQHLVGDGRVLRRVHHPDSFDTGEEDEAVLEEECPQCGGTGWLDGFIPPV